MVRTIWMMVLWMCIAVPVAAFSSDALPAPRGVTASDIGGGRAMVSWAAIPDEGRPGGRVHGYRVERQPAGNVPVIEVGGGECAVVDECGDGTFSYRVQTVGDAGESAFSPWVRVVVTSAGSATPDGEPMELGTGGDEEGKGGEILRGVKVGPDGWVELRPIADRRMVYVSSSRGSDRNDGLSESAPKRTIAAGYQSLRDGYPDWLLLKSGDVWEVGQVWWSKSGRSPEERMVVAVYGGKERAVWKTGRESAIHGNPRKGQFNANLVFRDLHLIQHKNDGMSGGAGFRLVNTWRDVLIENCRVEGFRVNLSFQGFPDGVPQRNIAVRRSVIVDALALNDAHAQGIYADGVDGLLIEENVLDHNGWGPSAPTASMFRHNAYIQTRTGNDPGCRNVVSKGNISARASATGLMQRPGGVVEGNLLLANPVGLVFGQRGGPVVTGAVRGNVVLDGRDIDARERRGTGLWLSEMRSVEVSDNIVAHQRGGTGSVVGINVDGAYADVTIRGNIVYDWVRGGSGEGLALAWHGEPGGEVRVESNHFQQVRGGHVVGQEGPLSDLFVYSGNSYYGDEGFYRRMTYPQWLESSGEEESVFARQEYPEAERTIERYMASVGRSGGLEEFLHEARQQSRANWREEYTADAVISYVREGFGVGAN